MYDTVIYSILSASRGNVADAIEKIILEENKATVEAEKALVARYPSLRDNIEEDLLLTDLETAYMDLGFYNGFRLAVQLMAECK